MSVGAGGFYAGSEVTPTEQPPRSRGMRCMAMKEVTEGDYLEFLNHHREVFVEGVKVPLRGHSQVDRLEPADFTLEVTDVWSFPKRGDWASHRGNYRGNWPPQIPRNLILRYTEPGETVLDMMVGGGTTLVECKLLGRNGVGVDIERDAVMLTRDRLNFSPALLVAKLPDCELRTYWGDARNLDAIDDASIDLIATHPPYANIIKYSRSDTQQDEANLSQVRGIARFIEELSKVAKEAHRVLRPGRYCAILMGDTRRNRHHVPIAFRAMQAFLDAGFVLKEDVIKVQWKTKTETLWARRSRGSDFLLLMHEHLFVFRKPEPDERLKRFAESVRWW